MGQNGRRRDGTGIPHHVSPPGTGYATLNLTVNYLKPVTTGLGEVRCKGRVVSLGRTVAVSEGELTDAAGRLLARATATCIIIHPPNK